MPEPLRGVLTPVVSPFLNGAPDPDRLLAQCKWLLAQDCGLAIFGTNSEGNSLSVGEKIELLDALIDGGLPAHKMMPGGGACALPEAVRLCRHIAARGCGGALTLPPFYYKDATDDGLFAFCADLIDQVGHADLRLYLYHIPPVAGVGFSLDLIERLITRFPEVVVGIKDSSRDDAHTFELLKRFPGWGVFPGNETNLPAFVRAGAVGTISATCNVNAAAIVDLYNNAAAPDADEKLAAVNRVRATFARWPMIAAMKAAIADGRADEVWANLRPPLSPLGAADRVALRAALTEIGFSMSFEGGDA